MSSATFNEKLQTLERRLSGLWDPSLLSRSDSTVLLEELGTAVEELHVAAAQLADAEGRTRAERSRYLHLFQLNPDAILTTDLNGVIAESNHAAESLFNAGSGYLRGKRLESYMEAGDRAQMRRRLAAVAEGGPSDHWHAWLLPRGDAEPAPIEVVCTTYARDSDETVLWSLRDVRERMRADRLERETLERDRRDVEEYAERLRRLEKAKSDFLDLASHELRGPMTVVRGYISMICEGTMGQLSEEVGGAVAIIDAKLEDMNRLVSQMLDTARVDDDRQMMSTQPLDLRPITARVIDSLRPLADQKRQRMKTVMPDEAVIVEVDRVRIGTVIVNLVENALKYSPEGSSVRCRLEIHGNQARLAVTDSGPGVEPASLEDLFSRFGRVVKPETRNVPGTGLGLYLAREIARRHGGDVTAECHQPRGSTFLLSLPLAHQASLPSTDAG